MLAGGSLGTETIRPSFVSAGLCGDGRRPSRAPADRAGRGPGFTFFGDVGDDRMKRGATWLGALGAGVAPAALVAQAATGTITGRVVDAETRQPIAAAQVFVSASVGASTNEAGQFRITGAPAGTLTVRVRRIGYQSAQQTVTLAAGGAATVDFSVPRAVTALEQVVVTATGEQASLRQTGNTVARIAVDSQPLAAINNFAGLVQGRAAGVTISQSGGSSGTGARVRIRGANSVSLSNEPLLVIDGVRINNSPNSNSIGVGGQVPSRLNDLNPNDIESVEVLKGPAAAGLYGTAAANGVIQVTTKRGRSGRTRWAGYTEQGALSDRVDYPSNYNTYTNPSNPASGATYCWLADKASGADCGTRDSLVSFNPLEDSRSSPFRTGYRQRYGLNASGGSDAVTFYLAGDFEGERGIYKTNDFTRRNGRANINARLLSNLNTQTSLGYLSSGLQLPQNDNNNLGLVSNGILGQARFVDRVGDTRGGYLTSARDSLFFLRTNQDIERFTGSTTATYTPASWLRVIGVGGYDVLNRNDNQIFPANRINNSAPNRQGSRTRNQLQIFNYTANLSAVGTATVAPALVSTTTLGGQFLRENTLAVNAFGAILLPGSESLAGTTSRFAVGETNADNRTIGLLAQEQLGWRDRLFVTGAVRGDRNSAFGNRYRIIYQPSASLSYVVSEEPFFPKVPGLSTLRLRSSFGTSSLRPGTLDAVQYYSAVGLTTSGGEGGGFTLGNLGNPNLKPERVTEAEGGLDLGLFRDRVNLEATYFSKKSRDALIPANLPASTGVGGSVIRNLGSVKNAGFEASLNAVLLDLTNVRFEGLVNFATLANKFVNSGGQPPIIFGLGGNTQQHRAGYPLGGYWQRPLSFSDANGNGVIDYDEYTVGDTAVYIGNPLPRRTLSVSPTLTLFKNFRVNALIDRQAGFYQYNGTTEFQCGFGTCADLYTSGTPLARQARALNKAVDNNTVYAYIQRGDFTRLRELSLTATLPTRFLPSRVGARGASVTLSGRNLKLWTKYDGFDPEVSQSGQTNFTQADFLTQPPVRYLMARLDLNF